MRWLIAGLLAALIGFGTAGAQIPAVAVNLAADAYIKPQRFAKLPDGRRMHLHCQGQGSPTVIFTAGLNAWSSAWSKVQPAIARHTRTCAWDRAGYGHSDPSPLAQTLANTTADLEGALAAGGIKGPYVLVGSSAGGFETLLFADRHRQDVVGMVLVDASVPDQPARFASISAELAAENVANTARSIALQRACAAALEANTLKPDQPMWTTCFSYFPTFSPRLVAMLTQLDSSIPARLRTQASLAEQFGPSAEAVVNRSRDYGDLPLVVLTQGKSLPVPGGSPAQVAALTAGWRQWHDDYAKLSAQGVNLIVQESGHNIQQDKPQAVIGAIVAVLDMASLP